MDEYNVNEYGAILYSLAFQAEVVLLFPLFCVVPFEVYIRITSCMFHVVPLVGFHSRCEKTSHSLSKSFITLFLGCN